MAPQVVPLLETRDLEMRYPGNLALDGVNFAADRGEIHAIVGANGAGKSTLMDILSGATTPTGGTIRLEGRPCRFGTPAEALRAGIACVYQELSLIPQLDVARNIYLGREPVTRWHTVDSGRLHAEAARFLDRHGLGIGSREIVGNLSIAQQQMVELARALSHRSKVLILDEPTSVLSISEKTNLFAIMRDLQARGFLIIYVSHFLGEVVEIADRITVLRDGSLVATRQADSITVDEIAELMTGRRAGPARPAHSRPAIETGRALSIRMERPDGDFEIAIARGEIVGIAGLLGSGRSTLARALAGHGGSVALTSDGTTRRHASVGGAIANGVVYITEDRKRDGLFAALDIVANTTASALRRIAGGPLRRPAREVTATAAMQQSLGIVAASLDIPVAQLSGGNQQKVLLARALLTRPRLLICDEPTRGVDVAAKKQIHDVLRELAESGVAVIVISSETEELLGLSNRILVMRDGRIASRFDKDMPDEAALLVAMSGDTAKETTP